MYKIEIKDDQGVYTVEVNSLDALNRLFRSIKKNKNKVRLK